MHAALGGNRFNHARVVILDVADPSAHRPASHLFRGKRRERGLQFSRFGGFLAQPDRPGFGFGDHRHAVM
jgi:hypothetical protein